MERKVYELSGNLTEDSKDQAVSLKLQNESDRIEGPATLNVVRVRCPAQYEGLGASVVGSGASLVEPIVTEISGNAKTGGGDSQTAVTANYDSTNAIDQPAKVMVQMFSDGTEVNIFDNGFTTRTTSSNPNPNAPSIQATVLPYNSPAEALINFEDAIDIAAKSGATLKVGKVGAGSPALKGHTEWLFYQTKAGPVTVTMYEHAGVIPNETVYKETLELRAGVTRFSPNIVDLPGFVRIPKVDRSEDQVGMAFDTSAGPTRFSRQVGIQFAKEVHANGPDTDYTVNTSLKLVDDVLELQYEVHQYVEFNDLAKERLALQPLPLYLDNKYFQFKGFRAPSFNDVRRIVMSLTPATERVVAIDAGYTHKLYDNASISFTIDDDPKDNSAYAMYSLASDFDTNALRLTSGSAQELEFQLQRCFFDRTTGLLTKPVALALPFNNNFVEVKLVVDKLKRDEPDRET